MEPLLFGVLFFIFHFYLFMATITRENIGLLNDRIRVQVNREDYLSRYQQALKDFRKKLNLPGFRKGMVPASVAANMQGQSLFSQEVIRTVEKELNEYLGKEKLNLFSDPIPENLGTVALDFKNPEDYTFDFEVGLKPEVELAALKDGFRFTRYRVKVDDSQVEETIERIRKRAGTRAEKDSITAGEDILTLQFTDSDADGNAVPDAPVKEEQMPLNYFSEQWQGKLMGNKVGYACVIKLSEAFADKERDFLIAQWKLDAEKAAGQSFVMTIGKIVEVVPAELTEQFFQEVYPGSDITTEEAFRARVREDEEGYWALEATKMLDHDIFEKLVHGTPLELPQEFLRKVLKQDGDKSRTDEEVDELYPRFDHDMRWNLISGKIIEDNGMEVSPEELRASFAHQVSSYFGGVPDPEKLDQYVDSMMRNEKAVRQAYGDLLNVKVFDWLREKAETEDKEVTTDEFLALSHNHHHHEHE
jgi:trigger factor